MDLTAMITQASLSNCHYCHCVVSVFHSDSVTTLCCSSVCVGAASVSLYCHPAVLCCALLHCIDCETSCLVQNEDILTKYSLIAS